MFKQKIKISLIEDYLDLLRIDKALLDFDNYQCLSHYAYNELLKNSYESLFLKFRLLDVSLLVLKKEVDEMKNNFQFSLNDVEVMQKKIVEKMIIKLDKFLVKFAILQEKCYNLTIF